MPVWNGARSQDGASLAAFAEWATGNAQEGQAGLDLRESRAERTILNNQPTSWRAVIRCALDGGAITPAQAEEFRNLDWSAGFRAYVGTDDPLVASADEMRRVPAGAFIAFIRLGEAIPEDPRRAVRHIVHAMISLGQGRAAGVHNQTGIGVGTDMLWEALDLAAGLTWIADRRIGPGINGAGEGVKVYRPLRVRYRPLDRVPDAQPLAAGQRTLVSMAALDLELLKRVSIRSAPGVLRDDAREWALVALKETDRRMPMLLARDTSGAWELTRRKFGWTQPVYFLPWKSKCIVGLAPGAEQGAVLATAALTGCSVLTAGSSETPTIYHAGIDGPLAEAVTAAVRGDDPDFPGGDLAVTEAGQAGSVEFWPLLLGRRLKRDVRKDPLWSEVNRTMYINDLVTKAADGSPTTARAEAVTKLVCSSHKPDPIRWDPNCLGLPFGSYLGFCSRRSWSFYLQENITFGYSNRHTGQRYKATFPIALTQVYPPGREDVKLIDPLPTKIAGPFTLSDIVVADNVAVAS